MRKKFLMVGISVFTMFCSISTAVCAETSIEQGEAAEVSTSYGDFVITVDNVVESDWMERSGADTGEMSVVLLECDVENVNFEDPYNELFFLENYLSVIDNEGYVVNSYGVGYSDGEYKVSPKIPKGAKAKVAVPYQINSDIVELTININEQYTLVSQIQGIDTKDSEAESMTEGEPEEGKAELASQNSELQAQVDELIAENEDLKLQIETLESEKEDLQNQINGQKQENMSEAETEMVQPSTEIIGVQYSDESVVKIVQTALNQEGFDCGTPDGVAGDKTTEAIRAYEKKAGINVNGVITDELIEALGIADKIDEAAKLEASKAEYSAEYTYEQLARNPDTYIGDKVKFSGKVLQADTGEINYIRLAVNSDYNTVIFVTYDSDVIDYRLLEDDYITIYGTSYSTYSYEAVSGATITLPWVWADIIEMQ